MGVAAYFVWCHSDVCNNDDKKAAANMSHSFKSFCLRCSLAHFTLKPNRL